MNETPIVDFEYKVLTELPGNNSRVVYIPNEGAAVGRDGVIVKFIPPEGDTWVGIFAFGDMLPNGGCKVCPGPGKNHLTIISKGEAYIASPYDPALFKLVKSCPVIDAISIPSNNLMVFYDFTEVSAYGENGLVWETKRISWDGIKIDEVTSNEIIGQSWDAPNEEYVEFRVNLTNGFHKGGAAPPENSS